MAVSTSTDHTQSGLDIITEALEILGALEEGESPSADQTTSCLRTLNNLIKLWSADTQIFAQNEYTLDLLTDEGQYQLFTGNVGYIPNKVLNATLINVTTNEEIPLTEITQQEWYALTDKTVSSRPTQYYQKRNPAGNYGMDLYVWPRPSDGTYDLKLWLQYPYRDIDTSADDVWFTQEWFLPLSYQLAFLLSPKYGVDISTRDRLEASADRFREEASSYDTDGSVYFQPARNNA